MYYHVVYEEDSFYHVSRALDIESAFNVYWSITLSNADGRSLHDDWYVVDSNGKGVDINRDGEGFTASIDPNWLGGTIDVTKRKYPYGA